MHSSAHCNTIYNSKNMLLFINNSEMDKENVVHLYNGIFDVVV